MKRWFLKLRGLLGLSTIGGVVGAVLGVVWVLVSGLLGYSWLNPATFVWGAGIGGGLGALTAAVIGGTLATLESGRPLAEISALRAGAAGAAGGAMAPVLLVLVAIVITGVGAQPFLPVVAICAGIGGTLGVGMVATAKRAARHDEAGYLDDPGQPELTAPD